MNDFHMKISRFTVLLATLKMTTLYVLLVQIVIFQKEVKSQQKDPRCKTRSGQEPIRVHNKRERECLTPVIPYIRNHL